MEESRGTVSMSTTEVVGSTALQAVTKAEIDVQIATAHRFERSMEKFKKRAIEMVSIDEDTAASCIYCRPVGKKWDANARRHVMEYAEGLSVRLAEIAGATYGNLRVGSFIVDQTDRYVVARGFAHDLESNFASATECIESTVTKDGNPYSERMRVVVAKAALAKARRDATFQVVPRALLKPIEAVARKVAIGDAETMAKRVDRVLKWMDKLGLARERVWSSLGINGEGDIDGRILTTLTGIKTAIKDGDITVDEAFPDENQEVKSKTTAKAKALKDRMKAASNGDKGSGGNDIQVDGELMPAEERDDVKLTRLIGKIGVRKVKDYLEFNNTSVDQLKKDPDAMGRILFNPSDWQKTVNEHWEWAKEQD